MNERTIPAKPLCFDSQRQWELWYDAAVTCARLGYDYDDEGNPKPVPYCTNCTPEYQQKMIAQNRCAWPEVKFVAVDGALHGRRAR